MASLTTSSSSLSSHQVIPPQVAIHSLRIPFRLDRWTWCIWELYPWFLVKYPRLGTAMRRKDEKLVDMFDMFVFVNKTRAIRWPYKHCKVHHSYWISARQWRLQFTNRRFWREDEGGERWNISTLPIFCKLSKRPRIQGNEKGIPPLEHLTSHSHPTIKSHKNLFI